MHLGGRGQRHFRQACVDMKPMSKQIAEEVASFCSCAVQSVTAGEMDAKLQGVYCWILLNDVVQHYDSTTVVVIVVLVDTRYVPWFSKPLHYDIAQKAQQSNPIQRHSASASLHHAFALTSTAAASVLSRHVPIDV